MPVLRPSVVSSRQTVTVDELAAVLGLGRKLVYQAIQRGEIPVIRIGRRILVPRTYVASLGEAAPPKGS